MKLQRITFELFQSFRFSGRIRVVEKENRSSSDDVGGVGEGIKTPQSP